MSIENKYDKKAKEKIKTIAEDIDIAMFHTKLGEAPINVAPMSTKQIDDQGLIWFLSNINHDTVVNIQKSPEVQLSYANLSNMEFMSVYGEAFVITAKDKLKELYTDVDDTWFDGVDDPNLRAIAVLPKEANYWEPKSGKLITLLKMAYGAVTGGDVDLGLEGKLKP